ncbi:DUF5017 domain-containing protein [Pedobacter sp. MW01-1-1]|uniref:DUF5017 domain-containing protein n=1 Tax=Pedobacter sp. MW01-1-1 TaxID=3383027 RepID=UPI003FEEE813
MKIKHIILVFFAVIIFGCSKEVDTLDVDFNVNLTNARSSEGETLVFKLGDTCKFALSGTAQNVIFYSGQPGQNYDYRNRSTAEGPISLSFTSTAQFGTQTNTLQVLAMKNLQARDSATVVNAPWVDITARVNLATSATAVASGAVNLSDILTNNSDSLFIAFKYSGLTGSTQRTWTITNFGVEKALTGQVYSLASLSSDASYWTRYGNVWTPASSRWVATATQLQIVGGAANLPSNTSWIVSKAIYANRVAPDLAMVLKSVASAFPTNHAPIYNAVGTYRAVFVGFNNSVDEQKEVVKSFTIKVIP